MKYVDTNMRKSESEFVYEGCIPGYYLFGKYIQGRYNIFVFTELDLKQDYPYAIQLINEQGKSVILYFVDNIINLINLN